MLAKVAHRTQRYRPFIATLAAAGLGALVFSQLHSMFGVFATLAVASCKTAIALATLVQGCCIHYGLEPPKPDAYKRFEGLVVGHRGCRGVRGVPENSMSAFKQAIELGADAVEFDCRLTKDKKLVIMHDGTIDRVLAGQGQVNQMTLAELHNIPYKASQECVPRVEDVLQLAQARGVKVLLEAKADLKETWDNKRHAKEIVALFQRNPELYQSTCVLSFHIGTLYWVRHMDPNIVTMALVTKLPEPSMSTMYLAVLLITITIQCSFVLKFLGVSLVGPHHEIVSIAMAERLQKANFGVYAWCVNKHQHASFFEEQNISIGTDNMFPRAKARTSKGCGQCNKYAEDVECPVTPWACQQCAVSSA